MLLRGQSHFIPIHPHHRSCWWFSWGTLRCWALQDSVQLLMQSPSIPSKACPCSQGQPGTLCPVQPPRPPGFWGAGAASDVAVSLWCPSLSWSSQGAFLPCPGKELPADAALGTFRLDVQSEPGLTHPFQQFLNSHNELPNFFML